MSWLSQLEKGHFCAQLIAKFWEGAKHEAGPTLALTARPGKAAGGAPQEPPLEPNANGAVSRAAPGKWVGHVPDAGNKFT